MNKSNTRKYIWLLLLLAVSVWACAPDEAATNYDLIVRGGTVYDGLGSAGVTADVAVNGDRIAAIGDLASATATVEIDATGKAVSPGFINMLSWAVDSMIEDGRAMSDIMQGVTLEVMGEGWSMGPLNDDMKKSMADAQSDIQYAIEWTTLGEYLEYLEARGVSPNIASYVGATTVRIHEIEYENRKATDEELERMRELVRESMRDGAIGVASSLIYAPANFADTDELIALVNAAAEYGGAYVSHIRSEGARLEEAVQELIDISRTTGAPAEIYHLKAAGKSNWDKLERVFEMVEDARSEGLAITANMYTYPVAATGLDAAMPLWVQEGGHDAWVAALRDPEIRARVMTEMTTPGGDWENLFLAAGPENMLLLAFKSDALKPLTGMTLAEVAEMRGTPPAETAIDLVIEDDTRIGTAYRIMSEENVSKKMARDWVSFGSDAEAAATEGVFLESSTHPRAYGTFARVIGKYVRDEGVLSLEEAIRRMTSQPAQNISIRDRGQLTAGYYADIVVFDPDEVQDHATFKEPHQYSTGVEHVIINGVQVLKDGEHTGATPGRVVRGPGWTGWN
ncbi:MAG: D-aminoacylase [Proteobacteria bacterium]|nr:D-aminoacylase [Pseudomonadota bacterium]